MAIDKFKRVDITLDKANKYILDDQLAKVGDIKGRDLVVQITNAGVVQNQPDINLTFSWHNKKIGNSGMTDFKALDRSQGVFVVTFPDEMNNAGNVVATIGVNEADKWTFSRNFIIKVEENSFTASAPLESDDWATLLAAIYNANHITELTEQQLTEFIEKSKEEWAAFVEANKDVISAIDPGGVLMNEIITARDGFSSLSEKEKNQDEKIKTIEDNTAGLLHFDDQLMPGGPFRASIFEDECIAVASKIDSNNFNLLNIADLHYEQDNPAHGYNHSHFGLNHVTNANKIAGLTDVAIMSGDNNNSRSKNLTVVKKQLSQVSNYFLGSGKTEDRFMIRGNHDQGSLRGQEDNAGIIKPTDIVTDADFKTAYRTAQPKYGETRDSDSLYFFKDYENKKVRLIVLDTNDNSDSITAANGSLLHPALNNWNYRQPQLTWLADVALHGVPKDYHTVVVQHVPLRTDYHTDQQTGEPNDILAYYNHDVVSKILNAFMAGTKVQITKDIINYSVNMTADFTEQGARVLVGVIGSHTHREVINTVDNIKVAEVLNSVCEPTGSTPDPITKPLRKPEDVIEDAFTVVSIDKENRTVYLYGFGAATDRQFTY